MLDTSFMMITFSTVEYNVTMTSKVKNSQVKYTRNAISCKERLWGVNFTYALV